MQCNSNQCDEISKDRRRIFGKYGASNRIRRQIQVLQKIPVQQPCLTFDLPVGLDERDAVENKCDREYEVGHLEMRGLRRMSQLVDALPKRQQRTGGKYSERRDQRPEVCLATVAQWVIFIGRCFAARLRYEEQYFVSRIGGGVERFGQQCARAREDSRTELGDCYTEVCHDCHNNRATALRFEWENSPAYPHYDARCTCRLSTRAGGCNHARTGVVIVVVTRAISTIIANKVGEMTPMSSPMLRMMSSIRPRVFIIAPRASDSRH